jgi:hypothetical protein
MLIGDIPNRSIRQRFIASEAGIAYHRALTGTGTLPDLEQNGPTRGADAYVFPQALDLPMERCREDILIRLP